MSGPPILPRRILPRPPEPPKFQPFRPPAFIAPQDIHFAPQNESEIKKRRRRRADEVERLYQCNWPGCEKSYGTLNHLNTHVRNAAHGNKREPKEFQNIGRVQKAKLSRKSRRNDCTRRPDKNESYHPEEYTTHRNFEEPYSTEHKSFVSPPHLPNSSRWSPGSFHDLYTRYPEFAKCLLSSHLINDGGTISPKRSVSPLKDEDYGSLGYLNYVEHPNGSAEMPRDQKKEPTGEHQT